MQKSRIKKLFLSALMILVLSIAVCGLLACGDGAETDDDLYTSYMLTFNTDGGSTIEARGSSTTTGKVTKPVDPTKSEHSFDGWYTEINGGGTAWSFDTILTENKTIYAKWTADEETPAFLSDVEVGECYIIDVAGWHETNNNASMMASLLYSKAMLAIGDYETEVTIHFVSGAIMGVPINGTAMESLRYFDGEDYAEVTSADYDEFTGVLTVKFSVEEVTEYIPFKIYVTTMSSDTTLRLKFDADSVSEAAEDITFNWQAGTYLVPVVGWHATKDEASMMSPLLYGDAFIEVDSDGTSTVTIYFISGSIQPPFGGAVAVGSSSITEFKYTDIGADELTDALLTYDKLTDVNKAVLMLSTTDISSIEYIVSAVSYPNSANMRLKFDMREAIIGTEPIFENASTEE